MTTRQDLQDKVQEIMEILYERAWYRKLTNNETATEYEKKLNRVAEKCGNLNEMIDNYKRE